MEEQIKCSKGHTWIVSRGNDGQVISMSSAWYDMDDTDMLDCPECDTLRTELLGQEQAQK